MERRSLAGTRRLALLAVLVLLTGGLVWGLATAFASSGSPSAVPAVDPEDRLDRRARQPQPLHRLPDETYEIWAMNYDLLFGYGDRNQPTLDLATQFPTKENGGISADGLTWTIKMRPGIKWQDGVPLTADDVAFTFNYIVKNQMANFTTRRSASRAPSPLDPTTVRIVCTRPKADLGARGCRSFPSTSGSTSRRRPRARATPSSCRSWAADPSRRSRSRRAATSTWCATRTTGAQAGHRPTIYFEVYQDADTMVTDLK